MITVFGMTRTVLLVIAGLVLTVGAAHADTISVPGDTTTIQAALDMALPGDTVLVAAGTYRGPGNRDLDFRGKPLVLIFFLHTCPHCHEELAFLRTQLEAIPEDKRPPAIKRDPLGHVSWSNHLSPEANRIKIELEKRAREGDPPTVALKAGWRERMEDMLWAVLNSPEFVFVP